MRFVKLSLLSVFLSWIIIQTTVSAQDKVQVVVKTITRELTLKDNEKLIVEAKKSKILLKGWDKSVVHIELKLIAKHPRKEIALKEVDYNKYSIIHEESGYRIQNYFRSLDNYTSVKSNLSAEYTIYIPAQLKMEIDNSYGSISIENARGEVSLTGKFCPVNVSDFRGKMSITTNYGDLQVSKIFGELTLNSKKSNSIIFQSQGTCFITTEYGETLLFPESVLDEIIITGNKSAVKIFIKDFSQYSYNLSTIHAEIQLPTQSLLESIKKRGDMVYFKKIDTGKPQMTVTTTFNSINIGYK